MAHNYSSTGTFTAAVSASNRVGPATKIHITVFVQDAISAVNLTVVLPHEGKSRAEQVYIAIGQSLHARAYVSSGTDVTFQFEFGEAAFNQSKASLAYEYHEVGNYSIMLDAFNHVSWVSAAFGLPIIVQEDSPIKGLSVQYGVTVLGDPTAFVLSMDDGSAFLCDWSFGDGYTVESDFSDLGKAMVHTYVAVGAYNITITCTNRHGSVVLSSSAWVQIPIGRLDMTSTLTPVTANTEVAFSISLESGSHVSYQIDFADGTVIEMLPLETTIHKRTDSIRHSYAAAGTFIASATAFNRLGNVQVVCNSSILVQHPIRDLRLTATSPVKLPDGAVVYHLAVPSGIPLPSDVTCRWSFGDNSTLLKVFRVDRRYQQVSIHSFADPGEYRTTVECSNNVSAVSLNASVVIHRLLKPLIQIKENYPLASGSPCFGVRDPFTLNVTTQAFDYSYTWSAPGANVLHTSLAQIRLSFRNPGLFSVRVKVGNYFGQMVSSLAIAIQSRISGVRFLATPTTMLSKQTSFLIGASVRGTDACYVVDLGEVDRDVILGGSSCLAGSDPARSSFIRTERASMSMGHVYSRPGNFTAALHAYNQVSQVNRTVRFEVWKPVCEVKEIVLRDLPDWTTRSSVPVNRFQKKSFLGQFEYSCSIVERVEVEWKIFKLTNDGEQPINSPMSIRRDEFTSMATFARYTLPYGTFRLVMLVEMTGRDVAAVYGFVNTEKSVLLEVTASELIASIEGGDAVQIGVEMNLPLDGSASRDPDLRPGETESDMTFAWFCRTDDANGQTVGCYEDARDPDVSVSGDAIFNTNTDEFSEHKTYIYKLEIFKGRRKASAEQKVLVVKGAPPVVEIR